jgi:hypothetical protein
VAFCLFLLLLEEIIELLVEDIGDEHMAGGVGDDHRRFRVFTAACGVTPQGQNTGTSPG